MTIVVDWNKPKSTNRPGFAMNELRFNVPFNSISFIPDRRGSAVGSASAWYADCRGFDPHIRQYSFVEVGHKEISTVILSLPLIQEGQLSVAGERMYTWLGGLSRSSVERLTDHT